VREGMMLTLIFWGKGNGTLAGEAKSLAEAQRALAPVDDFLIPGRECIADDAEAPRLGAPVRAAALNGGENLTLRAVQLAGQIGRGVLQME